MTRLSLTLLALVLLAGLWTATAQDDANAELKRKIDELEAILARRAKRRGQLPPENFVLTRTYEIGDLVARIDHSRLEPTNLIPSKYQPPEGREVESRSVMSPDMLIELLRQTVEPETWDSVEGASIEPKSRFLVVTNIGRVHGKLKQLLDFLRAEIGRQVVVDVVAMPVNEETAGLLSERPRELTPDEADALSKTEPLGTVRVVCANGQMSVQRSGKKVAYLQDYDVEIAKDSTIGDPIAQDLFVGLGAEILACLDIGGGGALLHCLIERTELSGEARKVKTEHGDVDAPKLKKTMLGTSLWVPFDRTVVAGGATAGRDACVILLRARLANG
ncbi:MAG: hypothetical protein ACYTGN_01585 [Planctomycetota bacterium]|jgi:hypothetical protein